MQETESLELGWWPLDRIGELQDFLEREWHPGHVLARDEQLLRWQHPRSADELSVVRAAAGARTVGVLGVIPIGIALAGRRVAGAWLTTWVVTPEARSRRVGLRLLDFVRRRHDFVGTLGGNATTNRILGGLGFRVVEAVPRWVRPLDVSAFARVTSSSPVAEAATAAPTGPYEVRVWSSELANRWDDTWRRTSGWCGVGTWHDAAYIAWRYASHPRFAYEILTAAGPDGEAGLIVYRLERIRGSADTVLRVVDAIGDRGPLVALAREAARAGLEAGAAFADFWCTSTRVGAAFVEAGFASEAVFDPPPPSRFQPLDVEHRPMRAAVDAGPGTLELDWDDVCFTRADCDQDRPS